MKIAIKNAKSVESVAVAINEPIEVNDVKRESTEHVARVKRVVLTSKMSINEENGTRFDYNKYRLILDDSFVVLYEHQGQTIARRVNYLDFHVSELLELFNALGVEVFADLYYKLDELKAAKVISYIPAEFFNFLVDAKIEFSRDYHCAGDEIEDYAGQMFTTTFDFFSTQLTNLELTAKGFAELENSYNEARGLVIRK